MGKASRVPFSERGGTLRGVLDLATGRYPSFLFGGSTGRLLPVFHLHEVPRAVLEPRLQFLAEHGYRTVTTDAIARLVRDGRHPGPFTVALCFDDARASLWTVAMPMLRKYNFCAITYAIPGRIVDANATRPTLDDGGARGSERPAVRHVARAPRASGGWTGGCPESHVLPRQCLLRRPGDRLRHPRVCIDASSGSAADLTGW